MICVILNKVCIIQMQILQIIQMECKLEFLLVVALHEIWLKLQFDPGSILRDRGKLLENGVESGKHSGKLSSGSQAFSFFIYFFF